MALVEVSKSSFKKFNALAVGESITGYFLETSPSSFENGVNMVFQINGEKTTLPAVGNLKYVIKDRKMTPGLLTVVTREEDKKVKGGKTSTQFKVQQDPDDSIEGAKGYTTELDKVASMSEGMASKIASLKA